MKSIKRNSTNQRNSTQVNQGAQPNSTSFTHFPQLISGSFSPGVPQDQINRNAQQLERHVAHTPFPHFGENRNWQNVNRPVNQHSYTPATYPSVMGDINSVTSPMQQSGRPPNSYMMTATLGQPIQTTQINYGGNSVNTGYTSHVGFFGQGSPAGFDRIATAYPNPPSPQISSPYNTPAHQPQTQTFKNKIPPAPPRLPKP